MRVITLIIMLAFVSSCSTATKSSLYSGIIGGTICGITGYSIGKETSPNKQSEKTNQLIGMGIGVIACGLTGMYLGKKFYEDDPENFKGEDIKIPERRKKESNQIVLPQNLSLSDLGV